MIDYSKSYEPAPSEQTVQTERSWPAEPLDAMFYGPLGALVEILDPHTEADRVAVLAQALVMFGSVVGRGPYYLAEGDRHHTNLNVVLVGATAKGRKGSSYGRVATIYRSIDPEWSAERMTGGLSSGEGLIHAVRDAPPVEDENDDGEDGPADEGVADKRLMVVEPEFASVLKVSLRDGNTLSAALRQAWDSGILATLTKHAPERATGAHISIIGHITANELRRHMDRTEAGNGFANRFMWCCVRRSKVLPFGGALRDENLAGVSQALRDAVVFCKALGESRIQFNADASALWAEVYEDLSEGQPGMLGAVTSRAEAQTVRLALIYAMADRSFEIRRPHLEAALALWRYAEDSARFVFGEALGDPLADEVLRLLHLAGADGMDREALREAFGRHRRSAEIGRALAVLAEAGLAESRSFPTEGRPREVWYCLRGKRGNSPERAADVPLSAHTALTAHSPEVEL